MYTAYIDWKQKEAGIYLDREWIDRFLIREDSRVGKVYRMRIIRPVPGLAGFILEGPGRQEFLLREKDCLQGCKSGQVVLVQVKSDGYDQKLPLVTEQLSLSEKDPLRDLLNKQIHFDPVPALLARLSHPLVRWMSFYPDADWVTDSRDRLKECLGLSSFQKNKNLLPPELSYLRSFRSEEIRLREEVDFSVDLSPDFAPERRKWLSRVIENEYAQIVIDRAEAACLIDINQTPATLKIDPANKVTIVNEASIPLLVRAIKLQEIEGIVLVDALRMPKSQGPGYLKMLKDELYRQYVISSVLGFSRAGLVEILVRRGNS